MAKKDSKDNKRKADPSAKKNRGTGFVNPTEAITKRASSVLAKPKKNLTVGDLEEALLKAFPDKDAESWDRTGLLVGERSLLVKKVAITLDPTIDAIKQARDIGANVLVTHHPLFLEAPSDFAPEKSPALSSGAGVWAAIQNQVSVMGFHTALDVSKQAQTVLPQMLGLGYRGQLVETIPSSKSKGYGQVCKVPKNDKGLETLRNLSARCMSVFGRAPRVWGDPQKTISSCVTATGSASNLVHGILQTKADCLICGEIKYHDALNLANAGVCIIELGHDVSEFPLTAVLASAVSNAGVDNSEIVVIAQNDNWTYPESIRL